MKRKCVLAAGIMLLLMAAEGSDFEEVTLYYNHLTAYLKWQNLGHVLAGGNGDIGDIEGKPEIAAAYELGKSIGLTCR